MKKLCKNIDITDPDFISDCIDKCLKNKKSDRKDVQRLKREYPKKEYLVTAIQDEIRSRHLELKPIWVKKRYDQGSDKWRDIAIHDIKQQIYDYICVEAMADLWKRFGIFQCASIPNRGQIYCKKACEKGMRKGTYFIKGDVHHFYQSINQDDLIRRLNRIIKNDDLLWLVETLIRSFGSGLAIGSYLSQYLANFVMSIFYKEMTETCHYTYTRRGRTKKRNCVSRIVIYMDDFVIFAKSKKAMRLICHKVNEILGSLGLRLKKPLQIESCKTGMLDMAGFKIYQTHTAIRKRNFIKIRRALKRFRKDPKIIRAKRLMSYWGFLTHSNSRQLINKYKDLKQQARKVLHGKSICCHQTA